MPDGREYLGPCLKFKTSSKVSFHSASMNCEGNGALLLTHRTPNSFDYRTFCNIGCAQPVTKVVGTFVAACINNAYLHEIYMRIPEFDCSIGMAERDKEEKNVYK